MHRIYILALLLVSCGPSVGEPDGDAGPETSSSSSGMTTGGDSASGPSGETAGEGTSESTGPGESGSTGEVQFEDNDILGVWLCEGEEDPFAMTIDDYMSPSTLSGSVCAAWSGATDPRRWQPCGSLSAHPTGGGAELPIFAEIDDPEGGMSWTVSATLFYSVATDSMVGVWLGPVGDASGAEVSCQRLK